MTCNRELRSVAYRASATVAAIAPHNIMSARPVVKSISAGRIGVAKMASEIRCGMSHCTQALPACLPSALTSRASTISLSSDKARSKKSRRRMSIKPRAPATTPESSVSTNRYCAVLMLSSRLSSSKTGGARASSVASASEKLSCVTTTTLRRSASAPRRRRLGPRLGGLPSRGVASVSLRL
jgi:hypothetical protein